MAVLSSVKKSFFSGWVINRTRQVELPAPVIVEDEEQVFWASIAKLPADEQQKMIQKREWYKRLAARQAIMEVEAESYRR
ncbi:MAG TPA: hypothetical protein VHP83_09395 [Aggregatilineaceae bacterium]|nr:hypothetical protein [Aggregatilineaceae bacterium]